MVKTAGERGKKKRFVLQDREDVKGKGEDKQRGDSGDSSNVSAVWRKIEQGGAALHVPISNTAITREGEEPNVSRTPTPPPLLPTHPQQRGE